MDENFKIPANKQFTVLMDFMTRNLAYTQIMEQMVLMYIMKLDPNSEEYLNQKRELEARVDEQVAVLYRYIFENYGDVGLDKLLSDT